MVTINLTFGYFIEKSGLDYVLMREYMSKPKKHDAEPRLVVKTIGYYGKSLDLALKDYLSLVQGIALDKDIIDIEHYIQEIKNTNDATVEEIKKLVGAE